MASQARLVESQHSFVEEDRCHPPRRHTLPWSHCFAGSHTSRAFFFFVVMIGGGVMRWQTPHFKPREILFFTALAV